MPLFIAGNLVSTDISEKDLLEAVEKLPLCSFVASELEVVSTVPQTKAIGVQEKGYLVLKHAPDAEYQYAGTDGLLHCIGLSIFDRAKQMLLIAHLDVGFDCNTVNTLLNEFSFDSRLEIRLLGGMDKHESNTIAGTVHEESDQLTTYIPHILKHNFLNLRYD